MLDLGMEAILAWKLRARRAGLRSREAKMALQRNGVLAFSQPAIGSMMIWENLKN